ncbi:RHS repeat domain-containing protein [Streptomyces sp. NPDC001282]|uniref:RHS repeat domain-containing protein n=1 Tax=Streptomyces sp. NPDC001282 TaxID=3364557 RepID=UPI0036D068B5
MAGRRGPGPPDRGELRRRRHAAPGHVPARLRGRAAALSGRTLTYRYDAAGQLTARSDALGRTVSYTYDQLGQVVRKDVAGKVTTYAYDRAGRLLHAAGPDYDTLGRRARRITPPARSPSTATTPSAVPPG